MIPSLVKKRGRKNSSASLRLDHLFKRFPSPSDIFSHWRYAVISHSESPNRNYFASGQGPFLEYEKISQGESDGWHSGLMQVS
jgi:hypothetical protein